MRVGARTKLQKIGGTVFGRKAAVAAVMAAFLAHGPFAAAALAETKSVYSPLEAAKCLLFQKEPLGKGRVCAGVEGHNLVLTEFDDRAALELVHADWRQNAIIPVSAVAPQYSWFAGDVAEWRLGSQGAFAMILRIGVAATRNRPRQAETRLLVVKLPATAKDAACLVGAVAGRSGANAAARAMADQAKGLPCLR